ncbi:unnamed protein product, partial [Heligmosomoides polygyrus]|uniref:5'-nucleotidase domain-containing protein 1 n=1 Tax=Heligmosomoides polygyrus TaxID=6339 RepID=A0A183G1Y9_HELPZ
SSWYIVYELSFSKIKVYGFDYDYTLAVYKRSLNELIYKLSLHRLISQFKYPKEILDIPYDSEFAIRGLHFDVQSSCLLKVDAFSQIQSGLWNYSAFMFVYHSQIYSRVNKSHL